MGIKDWRSVNPSTLMYNSHLTFVITLILKKQFSHILDRRISIPIKKETTPLDLQERKVNYFDVPLPCI